VERRLYAEKLSASSFLHQEDKLPRDRYHPNYLVDGDPLSAWNEGAASSGAGEWVQLPLSHTEGVSRVRLRLLNGYQKSEAIFAANARAKTIQVELLPSGQKKSFSLADGTAWQEFSFEVSETTLDGLKLTVEEVYEGKKYKDLCLSELEIFVSASSPEDPAKESATRDSLLAWIKGQKENLRWKESPLLAEYRVRVEREIPWEYREKSPEYQGELLRFFPVEAHPYLVPDPAQSRPASQSRDVTFLSDAERLPEAPWFRASCDAAPGDGDTGYFLASEWRSALPLPCSDGPHLLRTVGLKARPARYASFTKNNCGLSFTETRDESSKQITEIEIAICHAYEEEMENNARPGSDNYRTWTESRLALASQQLSYDEQGHLRFLSSSDGTLVWYQWGEVHGRSMITEAWVHSSRGLTRAVGVIPASAPASAPTTAPVAP
jgi:hypothetical protein